MEAADVLEGSDHHHHPRCLAHPPTSPFRPHSSGARRPSHHLLLLLQALRLLVLEALATNKGRASKVSHVRRVRDETRGRTWWIIWTAALTFSGMPTIVTSRSFGFWGSCWCGSMMRI
jgi:hypothetical protein